jgi:hypothetical protein
MGRSPRQSPAAPAFDPEFGDAALAGARQDLLIGRWQSARDLIRQAGRDWDLRTYRLRLLADAAAGGRVVETWQAAEPRNPDALVLRAETEVARAFAVAAKAVGSRAPSPGEDSLDRVTLNRVVGVCGHAVSAAEEDPMPWISLLTLARLYAGGHPRVWDWWRQIQARDPFNREAHHQTLRYLSARWHGSHGVMYDFARDSAAVAPLGSPLSALLQTARVEHYRQVSQQSEGRLAPGLAYHWAGDGAVQDLRITLRHWIAHRDPRGASQDVADLNTLAYCLVRADMFSEAADVFQLIGDRAARSPWSLTGDPLAQFTRWRDRLLGNRR